VPAGSNYILRWVTSGLAGCTSIGAPFNWNARCEDNNGFGIKPYTGNPNDYSGFPNPTDFTLEPYTLNRDAFVVAWTIASKKFITTYTVGKAGAGLAITIQSPDGSKWASTWFAIP